MLLIKTYFKQGFCNSRHVYSPNCNSLASLLQKYDLRMADKLKQSENRSSKTR